MNEENFGGNAGAAPGMTPNPLNPTPNEISQPESTLEKTEEIQTEPTAEKAEVIQTEPSGAPKTEVIADTASPVDKPMVSTLEIEAAEAAAKVEENKKKKSKKGLIIGLVVGFIVLAGGVIGAMFALGVFKPADPVVLAVSKLFEGPKPDNVHLNGTIKITPKDTTFIKSATITLDSAVKTGSMINATKAELKATTSAGDLNIGVEEVYANAGEIFLKLEGIESVSELIMQSTREESLLNESSNDSELDAPLDETLDETLDEVNSPNIPINDCVDSEDELSTNCVSESASQSSMGGLAMLYILQMFDAVDGEWIRISLNEVESSGIGFTFDTQCLTDAYKSITNKGNLISEIYKKNSFVSSTNENLRVSKKINPIYKLVFDAEKITSFSNEIEKNNIVPTNCVGNEENTSADEIQKTLKNLPAIYVEIDGNHNFTRFYTSISTDDGSTLEVDLDLSYPSTIDVAEPIEYTDLESIIQDQMMNMMNVSE